MRKLILLVLLGLTTYVAHAYYYEFTITEISSKQITESGEWSEWGEWEEFSGKVTLDTEKEKLSLYLKETHSFDVYGKIINNDADGEGSNILQYSCVDDEGLKCVFRLRNSTDGSMQIYVDYDEFSVVYQVETTSNMYTLFPNYYAPETNKTTHILSKNKPSPKIPTQSQINNMRSTIENVRTEHNVYENGKKGMKIYTKFTVHNMKDFEGLCIAWFADANNNFLNYHGTSNYTNNSGSILSYDAFVPIYDDAVFTDFEIFMPYEELHKQGDMTFYVELREKSTGKNLANSSWYSFRYGNANTSSSSSQTTLSVSKSTITATSYGTTEYITVTSDKPWEVQHPSGTMYSVTRNGNTLTVKINPNYTNNTRTDYFNIRTTDGSKIQKIQLTQLGSTNNSSSSNSNYGNRNYSLTKYQQYTRYCGDYEITWFGIRAGICTGISYGYRLFSFRLGPVQINPAEITIDYNLVNEEIAGIYTPSVDFFIPFQEDAALYFGGGPSVHLGISDETYVWADVSAGVHWHWGVSASSDFFVRYNGSFMFGVSIQWSTDY